MYVGLGIQRVSAVSVQLIPENPEQFMFTLSRVLFLYNCKNIADRRAGYLGTIYVMFAKVVQ